VDSCPDIGLIFGVHDLRPQLLNAARRAYEAGKLPAWKIERVSPYDFRHGRTTQLANRTKHLAGVSFLVGHKDPSRRSTCTPHASTPRRRGTPFPMG
jgi:integrase